MKVPVSINGVLLTLTLASCSSAPSVESAQYQSEMERLERPPKIQGSEAAGHEGKNYDEPREKTEGLGDKVALSDGGAPALIVKQPLDATWKNLELTLRRLKIDILKRDREQKTYSVAFDADGYAVEDAGLLQKLAARFFGSEPPENYVIKVEGKEAETKISVTMATASNGNGEYIHNTDGYVDAPTDHSQDLLRTLYTALRDGVDNP